MGWGSGEEYMVEEEVPVKLDLEAINFDSAAMEFRTSAVARVTSTSDDPVMIKLRCSDLEHFHILPSVALLPPRGHQLIHITRLPKRPCTRDERLDVHYLSGLQAKDASARAINRAFARYNGPPRFLSLLLRVPWASMADQRHNLCLSIPSEEDETRRSGSAAVTYTDQLPPAVALPDPQSHVLFFPPWEDDTECAVLIRNPHPSRRLAVKVKSSGREALDARPAYLFLGPESADEVRLRHRAGHPPPRHATQRLRISFVSAYAAPYNSRWKDIWARVKGRPSLTASVSLPVHVMDQPFLYTALNPLPVYQPHSTSTLALLALKNVSPVAAQASLRLSRVPKASGAWRASPTELHLSERQCKCFAVLSSAAPPRAARLQVVYWREGSEERADRRAFHVPLRLLEEPALRVSPTDLGVLTATSQLCLFNESSAPLAVRLVVPEGTPLVLGAKGALLAGRGKANVSVVPGPGAEDLHEPLSTHLDLHFAYSRSSEAERGRPEEVVKAELGREAGSVASCRVALLLQRPLAVAAEALKDDSASFDAAPALGANKLFQPLQNP